MYWSNRGNWGLPQQAQNCKVCTTLPCLQQVCEKNINIFQDIVNYGFLKYNKDRFFCRKGGSEMEYLTVMEVGEK